MAGTLSLWVDDAKPAPAGCAVARTYDDALAMLRRFDYETLYLDHDLGEARTGYDLLVTLIDEGRVPANVLCISWNPVGRQRIIAALDKYKESTSLRALRGVAPDLIPDGVDSVAFIRALRERAGGDVLRECIVGEIGDRLHNLILAHATEQEKTHLLLYLNDLEDAVLALLAPNAEASP